MVVLACDHDTWLSGMKIAASSRPDTPRSEFQNKTTKLYQKQPRTKEHRIAMPPKVKLPKAIKMAPGPRAPVYRQD